MMVMCIGAMIVWGLSSHGDFHFLRLDGKVWSHKLSKDAAEDLIEDRYPDAEDLWFRGSIKKYNSDIVYMVVKDIWLRGLYA